MHTHRSTLLSAQKDSQEPWRAGNAGMLGVETAIMNGFLGGLVVKNLPANAGDSGSVPGVGKIIWRRKWQSTLVLLPGKFHGQRNLAHRVVWGHKELDMTEHTHIHN